MVEVPRGPAAAVMDAVVLEGGSLRRGAARRPGQNADPGVLIGDVVVAYHRVVALDPRAGLDAAGGSRAAPGSGAAIEIERPDGHERGALEDPDLSRDLRPLTGEALQRVALVGQPAGAKDRVAPVGALPHASCLSRAQRVDEPLRSRERSVEGAVSRVRPGDRREPVAGVVRLRHGRALRQKGQDRQHDQRDTGGGDTSSGGRAAGASMGGVSWHAADIGSWRCSASRPPAASNIPSRRWPSARPRACRLSSGAVDRADRKDLAPAPTRR